MIKLENVNKSFHDLQVLKNINLSINKGEVLSLIGPSGCGKSTLLKCINGLEKISSGQITIDGVDISKPNVDLNKIRAEVGIVFQQFNLFPHMTVRQNVMLAPMKIKKISKSEANQLTEELLEKVGIIDKIDKYPHELSGGQAQRVAIARSLAMKPIVILLDEPTSALDPKMTNEVLDTMKTLAKDGMTMVIVTHEMTFAKEISKRIVFIDQGEIIEEGSPDKLFNNAEHHSTFEFLQSVLKNDSGN